MQYALLIYTRAGHREARDPFTDQQVMQGHYDFVTYLQGRGAIRGGEPLQPVETATSVRVSDTGETLVTDGPFAETREHLGGFYLVEADDLDDAIQMAARIPDAKFGTVEIRPIMKLPGNPM